MGAKRLVGRRLGRLSTLFFLASIVQLTDDSLEYLLLVRFLIVNPPQESNAYVVTVNPALQY